jgi:hypothetical protein
MAKQTLTKSANPGIYSNVLKALTMTASQGVTDDDSQFAATGKEYVVAHNTDGAVARTVTIKSVADPFGRSRDVTKSLAVDEIAFFGPIPKIGYMQADGNIYLHSDDVAVKFGVLMAP